MVQPDQKTTQVLTEPHTVQKVQKEKKDNWEKILQDRTAYKLTRNRNHTFNLIPYNTVLNQVKYSSSNILLHLQKCKGLCENE